MSVVVVVPVCTCLMPRIIWQRDRTLALEELHTKAFSDMPGNVTVHEPVFLTFSTRRLVRMVSSGKVLTKHPGCLLGKLVLPSRHQARRSCRGGVGC